MRVEGKHRFATKYFIFIWEPILNVWAVIKIAFIKNFISHRATRDDVAPQSSILNPRSFSDVFANKNPSNSCIQDFLNAAVFLLPDSDTARLDVEIALKIALNVDQGYLYAHPEQMLLSDEKNNLIELLGQRKAGKPMAYLIGYQEFWSLDFKVNEAVLIPRQETELLVELALKLFPQHDLLKVADLGTGSGAIALSLATERSAWQITATDISENALTIARLNAEQLGVSSVRFLRSNWCDQLVDGPYDLVISNPPYIAQNDTHLQMPSMRYEPRKALIAEQDGLADLAIIIQQAKGLLNSGGYLLLEHGYNQGQSVRELFVQHRYQMIETRQDLSSKDRVTFARKK